MSSASAADQLPNDDKSDARWLRARLARVRGKLRGVVLLGTLEAVCIVVQAWALASLIYGAIVEARPVGEMLPLFGAFLGSLSLRAVARYAGRVLAFDASVAVRQDLRRDLLAALRRLGPAYCARRDHGTLTSMTVEQVEAVAGYVARFSPQMQLAVAMPLVILIAAFAVNWIVGLIFLFTAPLIPVFMALTGRGAAHLHRRNFDELARLGAHFLDRIRGLTTLKLFDLAQREAMLVGSIADRYRRRTMDVLKIAFLSSAVLEFFASVAIALVAVYVGLSLLGDIGFGAWSAGGVSLFAGIFVLVLAPEFFMPLRELAAHYHDRAAGVGAVAAIIPVLDDAEALTNDDTPPPAALPRAAPRIVFDQVTVEYADDRQPALRDFSLTAEPGEHVALVGASGTGKSTVLAVLLGFVTPRRGHVLIDGQPLTALQAAGLHRLFGYVPQRAGILRGSVRENLLLAQPEASPEAMHRALGAANARGIVEALPEGLETRLGEDGYGLSGGQIQRLALARAFLADRPALLLDEPTAALDAASEGLVLDGIDRLRAGRTVLVATHSRRLIARADRIVSLDAPPSA